MTRARRKAPRDTWFDGIGQRMQRGDYHGALAALLPAVQAPGAGARVFEFTVICFLELRDEKTAEALADAALAQHPGDAWLWALRARIDLQAGREQAARGRLERALALDPGHLGALTTLNLLAPFDKGSRADKRLRRAVKSGDHTARARAAGHNGIARIEAAAGNPARAFHHFTQCNRLRGGRYDPARDLADVAAQAHLPDAPAQTRPARYLFVGGMPRSGTTVLEAALCGHSDVVSTGETTTLSTIFERARKLGGGGDDWPARLTGDHRQDLRADLTAAYDRARGGQVIVIEKMPLACLHFGLARWLLPDARFIQMVRHPLDCGLSNYVTNFNQPHGWSTRLDWIAAKIGATETARSQWATRLGPAFRTQSFDSLVRAPEAALRDILRFLGLDWQAACHNPEAAGAQRTASMLQVRAGFNRAGLGKWRAYEAQLAPLIDALGGPAAIAGWDEDGPAVAAE